MGSSLSCNPSGHNDLARPAASPLRWIHGVPGRGSAGVDDHLGRYDIWVVKARSAGKDHARHTGVFGVNRRPAAWAKSPADDIPATISSSTA